MAFPWSRGESTAEVPPAGRRRRSRDRRIRQDESRREASKAGRERRHQRVAIGIGSGLILLIFAILSFGYYQEFYKPPRVWAGSVNNVEFSMGDLVQRLRVLQGLTGRVDLSTGPFDYLRFLLDVELLRQEAPLLGFGVTDDNIDEALKAQFYPQPDPGQQSDQGQLEREYKNSYQIFLARTSLSDQDYRRIVEEQLLLQQLRAWLGFSIEDPQEQVEVAWIRLDVQGEISGEEVLDRLKIQDFATVANDVSLPAGFAGPGGYVGWVPRLTFPNLDDELFGDEENGREPLEVGEISNLIFTTDGMYIIHKLSGPEQKELADNMRQKLNTELVTLWQRRQQLRGSEAGWLRMNFNSKWYEWVADQVNISAPRQPQGQR